jgi:type I restriction enzyme S subunit
VTSTLINTLPKHWKFVPISDIAEVNPKLDKRNIDKGLEVSFVPMPAVKAETGVIDVSATRLFGDVKKGYTGFIEGDVLFAKITPCMENGKMAVAPELKNKLGFGSTEFHVLRPNPGVSKKYLYYFVSSKLVRYEAEHNMAGAVGQKRVPASYLANKLIPVPPTKEQLDIVAKIETLFSELDKGLESLKTARKQLKVYRQAVLKHAFEGKLTAQWRVENKAKLETPQQLLARIQQERQARYQQQLKDWEQAVKVWEKNGKEGKRPTKPRELKPVKPLSVEVKNVLPDIPEEWAWQKLGRMTCGVEYGTAAKSAQVGAVPVIRMGNLQNGTIDWNDLVFTSDQEEIEKYKLESGDVIFNRTNSPELVGKTSIYRGERPAVFAGYLIRLNQIGSIVSDQYLNLFLNSHVAKQYGNTVKTDGVNQSNINGEKLQGYPFPYCSFSEQDEIVRILEEKLSLTDSFLVDIEKEIDKSESLRQSILNKAFSGQLIPQEPQ